MKVAILTNSSSGLWSFRRELICELVKQYEVVVSTPDTGRMDDLRGLGVRISETFVDRRGTNPIKDLRLLFKYVKLLKDERPDLVITYTIKPNIYGSIAANLCSIPVAVNITGLGTAFEKAGLVHKLVLSMYGGALRYASVVFFENSSDCDFLVSKGLVNKEQTCVLPGAGVNLDYYSPLEYPGLDHPFRFLFIGRIMKEKGMDELLAAVERLHVEGNDVLLDVLGNYEEDYSAQFERAASEGWLEYHGEQNDIRPFVEKSHCFVLPSYHEGMANTNLECSAMARPIITSNIPGCKEAVIDGESGMVCESKNMTSLYAAMKSMLGLSNKIRCEMGMRARRHMEDVFDKTKVVGITTEKLDGFLSIKIG